VPRRSGVNAHLIEGEARAKGMRINRYRDVRSSQEVLGRPKAECELAEKHPRKPEFAFARRINQIRKIVFSRTLTGNQWPSAELATRSLVEEVDQLKAQSGKNIITFGGAGFAAELIDADLVDEFQFYANPIALHEGLSIFKKKGIDVDLELISAQSYDCGMVVSKYAPRGRA
jgi:dihydrofolate reductase